MKNSPFHKIVWLLLVPAMLFLSGCNSLFTVNKKHMTGDSVGEEYQYHMRVTANENVANVMIEQSLPKDVTFVRSEPAPSQQNGNKLMWTYHSMDRGEERNIDLFYTPKTEGEHHICTAVSGVPRCCVPLIARMPKVEIKKMGPREVELGTDVTWTIEVDNMGTGVASGVKVMDMLPSGFTAKSPTEYHLGDIRPGGSETVQVTATANTQGDFTNTAKAMWSSHKSGIEAQSPIRVIKSMLKVSKTGPEEAYVFSPSAFKSSIMNAGETTLHDVRVTEMAPSGATITDADGGSVMGSQVTWTIAKLEPGETRTFTIMMAANKPGMSMNKVIAKTSGGLQEMAEYATTWYAAPGLSTSLVDERDPIQVGETTVFIGQLSNTSQFKPIEGALARILLSEELEPIAVTGDTQGVIRGQEVLFSNLTIQPGQTVILKVQAKGRKAGPGGAVMQVKADFLPKVISNEESTTVVGR